MRLLGVERRSVRRWKATYLKKGFSVLQTQSIPGYPPKLDPKDKKQLEQELLK